MIRYWFIWLYYNDLIRMIIMVLGTGIVSAASIRLLGEPFACLGLVPLSLLLVFNDYSNLRKIGMNEYREIINSDLYYKRGRR